jgi:deazaflavin-dependent oxidoreductase (nitroreductase family)
MSEEEFLYLTTTGWKSGRPHEIEIWFVGHGGKFYLISQRGQRSHWVQNIKGQPVVSFRVGQTLYKGRGREVDGKKEADLVRTVSARMNEKYEWSQGLTIELAPNR